METSGAARRKSVATAESRGHQDQPAVSRGAAIESSAAPRLMRPGFSFHGLRPRLRSFAAPQLLALLLLFATSLFAQDQPFTIRVRTQLVVQAVSITGKDGRPIEGLTKDDFIITEDGVPQTISVFEFQKLDDTIPVRSSTPAAPATVQQAVGSTPGSAYQDRRMLALFFDMDSLGDADRYRALASAQTFIDTQMKGPDVLSIFTYADGAVHLRRDFTDNRAALAETILALFNNEDLNDTTSAFGQDSGEFNVFNTDRQLAALQTVVSMLGIHNQKKSLIYFTGGMRLNGVDNQAQLRATLNAARKANVTFYPIDARGLVAMPPMGDASRPSPGGIGMYTGAMAMASLRGLQRSQDALYTLAADTGGKALLDYNDLSLGIVRAQQANSSYYILGYYPTNTNRDGRLRRVKISLKDRSADLSYREAYYAEKEFNKFTAADKERQLEEALMLGDPITEITMAMELNYFQLNSAEYFVPLSVKMSGNELVLAQKAGADRTLIDFIGEIKDEFGTTIRNFRDKVEIKLKGETASLLASTPIHFDAGFTLLPSNYVIKFLARNAETGRIGTYEAKFVVPNLNKELVRLPISSVVLGSQRIAMQDALFTAGKTKTEREQTANPLIEGGLKLIPSVTRVFSKTRDMLIYLQAYERQAVATQPVAAFVTFFHGTDKVFETTPFLVTSGMDEKSKSVPIKLSVPLVSLPNGEYLCSITVIHPDGQKAAFWQAPVRIVP